MRTRLMLKNIVIFCYKASFLSIENSINGFYYSSTLILAEMGSNFLQQVAGLFDLGKKKKIEKTVVSC